MRDLYFTAAPHHAGEDPTGVTIRIVPRRLDWAGADPGVFEREGRQLFEALAHALPAGTMDQLIAEHTRSIEAERAARAVVRASSPGRA